MYCITQPYSKDKSLSGLTVAAHNAQTLSRTMPSYSFTGNGRTILYNNIMALNSSNDQSKIEIQVKELADKLMMLENQRLEQEKYYVSQEFEASVSDGLDEQIEQIFQEQKKIVIELAKISENCPINIKDAAYSVLWDWYKYDEKYRYLPRVGIDYEYTMVSVKKVCMPNGLKERYKLFFEVLNARYSWPSEIHAYIGYGDHCGVPDKEYEDLLIKRGIYDFTPIVAQVDYLENSRKYFPHLWAVNSHDGTTFSALQVRCFVIPELRRLRHTTQNIYLKNLINYHCVLFRKVDEPANLYL